jgi:D-alanyl-lipoteichoic acid acyltransferase DltB (MBOAT superfamily)
MDYVTIIQNTIDLIIPLNLNGVATQIVDTLDYFKQENLYSYFINTVIKNNIKLSGVCFRELLINTENYDVLFKKVVQMYVKSDISTKFVTQSIADMSNTDSIDYLKNQFKNINRT